MKKITLFLLLVGFLVLAGPARADNGQAVIAQGETINGNWLVAAETVVMDGVVNGEVYAAGGQVNINGEVNGDVLVAAGTVRIGGVVNGDVRVIGGNVVIEGEIAEDLTVVGGNVDVDDEVSIGSSIVGAGGNINIRAAVPGIVTAAAGQLTIDSRMGGVRAAAGRLSLGSRAEVAGNVEYWSDTELVTLPGAVIEGETTRHELETNVEAPQPEQVALWWARFRLVSRLISLVSYLVVAYLVWKLLPVWWSRLGMTLESRPWASLGIGFLILILTPILVVVLLATVIGMPIGLIILGFYLLLTYLAVLPVVNWLGELLGIKGFWAVAVGLVIYEVLLIIPVLGLLVRLAVMVVGMGVVATTEWRMYREFAEKGLV